MLAITASTTPPPASATGSRTTASVDLDRAERGVTTETDDPPSAEEGDGAGVVHEEGYENIVVRVGVVETIRGLWDNQAPLVRRFR
jgi:hypothetical protein